MGKCALCGKKFLFGKFDENGYCPSCSSWHKQNEAKKEQQRLKEEEDARKVTAWIDSLPTFEIEIPEKGYLRQKEYEEFDFSNITPKGTYDDIVAFDTETTGLAPSRDRIIELAAIRYVNGSPVEKFHSYVNPERPIPAEASQINHITDDMVAGAPTIGQILPSFEKFVGKSTLVAHNLEFDLKFLYYSGSKILETKRKYIDTLDQAHKLIKKDEVSDYQLETLCWHFNHNIASAHSALADAFAVGWLFHYLVLQKQGSVVFQKTPDAPPKSMIII